MFKEILADIALGKSEIGKEDSQLAGLRDKLLVYALETYYDDIVKILQEKDLPIPKKQYILIHRI